MDRVASVPSTLSTPAQAYLREHVRTAQPPAISLDDTDGWLAHFAAGQASMLAACQPFDRLPVSSVEHQVGGARLYILRPAGAAGRTVYLDFHGGGFALGGGDACRLAGMASAHRTNLETWSVDYRMPPLHPYPAAVDDGLAVYRGLLEERSPDEVIIGGGAVGGGAAGGNLAAATLLRAREDGLPMPAGLMLFSPLLDLTESGDSFRANHGLSSLTAEFLQQRIALYAKDINLADPYLSPLAGDVSAFPPTLIVSGTRDLLLSDAARMHRKLRKAGVDAELHVWEAMSHGGFGGATPEDLEVGEEIRRFITRIRLPSQS
jgi:epsilon-lactone hydrolase